MNLPTGDRTPMLDQYAAIKRKFADAILFYRMGDFYEMFYEDARIASEILGLRLTSRAHGKSSAVPLAGFPYHQLDTYLTRMVEAGRRVVIVEQVEDPKKAKGLVKRDVVKVVTAGTNPATIDRDEPGSTKIASLIRSGECWGAAWADIGSGEFVAGDFSYDELKEALSGVMPVELVVPSEAPEVGPSPAGGAGAQVISKLEDWVWEPAFARRTLLDHFATVGLKGFGLEELPLAISAAGALLYYLKQNLRTDPTHLTRLARAEVGGKLRMESTTRRNLELVDSLSGNPKATLFAVIDRSVTQAGRRLLYARLLEPLAIRRLIEERLEAVDELVRLDEMRVRLRNQLRSAGDLRRALARLVTGRGSARDLVALRETLLQLPQIQETAGVVRSPLLQSWVGRIDALPQLTCLLQKALLDEPPVGTTEGGMIKSGYDARVDELRDIRSGGRSWLENYEATQRHISGIPNLKVSYNRVFNYYIEITRSHLEKVPPTFIRRQTLVNAERYTTAELQGYEEKLLSAEELVCTRESEIFTDLVQQTLRHSIEIQESAQALSELDFFSALAQLAVEENFRRPELSDENSLELNGSRHPVVEKLLPPGEMFVPNDLTMTGDRSRILIVTGPNMAGKSTYLRQVGLITILAQMGSFVPAEQARLGIVDRLFTRIGALDNLAGGESTFLVEMQETASILNNATDRSLVLFDEVGRGTSTFDGLSLAWAIVEYLHETPRLKPRTLFATHFHEMVELEKYLSGVKNLNVAVREVGDRVVFLRKIVPGGSDRSFGIHVAQMAGIPKEVTSRAREILANLEANDLSPVAENGREALSRPPIEKPSKSRKSLPTKHLAQLAFFDPFDRKLRDRLAEVDLNGLTPLEALNLVAELKRMSDD
jgi:DNA mismatch repair protein MutS